MKNLRWLALLFIVTVFVSIAPGHSLAQTNFTDVKSTDEFYKHVNYIAERDIITGYADGKFKPYNNLTRFQAAKMLIEATGNSQHDANHVQFADLKSGEEYYFYLSKAVDLGFLKTNADNTIEAFETIKRDEMGYALAVAFNLSETSKDKPLVMPDVQGHPYADKVNGLYYAGITQGSNGAFMPDNLLTRAQFSMFLARAMNPDYTLPVKPPSQTSDTSFVKVNTVDTTLNIRKQPSASSSSEIVGKLAHGTIVEVFGKQGDWLQIVHNGTEGYINGTYTTAIDEELPEPKPPVKPTPPPPPVVSNKVVGKVTADSLNVRAGESTSSAIITKVTRGQKIDVLSLNGNWAKVQIGSTTGYVSKIYLKLLNQSNEPLKNRIIVIDAGHGGHDPGASSRGLTEKSVTLKVSKLVEEKLKKAGAKVLMTRSNDTYLTLQQRTDFTKKNFGETFVSIHVNAATASAKGTEVFMSSANPNGAESRSLARFVQNNIVKQANMVDRGVKDKGFAVIKNNNVAAILVELGFITNTGNNNDFNKLSSDKYLEIYAEAIYQGLVQYYSVD